MQWYKQIIALFSAVIVATVFLTSCVADKFDDCPTDNREIVDGKAYRVSFRLKSVSNYSGTRSNSGEFVDGSDGQVTEDGIETAGEEHAIGTAGNFAIFFDESKKLYSVTALSLPDHSHWPANNIEAEYGTVFYAVDGKLPSHVLVILNGERLYERLIQKMDANKSDYDINAVLKEVWSESDPTSIGRDKDGHFTMTNSIYFDKDGVLQQAVPVTPKMIHEVSGVVPDPNLPKDEVLTIYVERMLSKFTFDVDSKEATFNETAQEYVFEPEMDPQDDPKGDKYIRMFNNYDEDGVLQTDLCKWEVAVTGWAMNALESDAYLYKRFSTTENYFDNWKDPANYRTYWAEDRNYNNTDYPWQYRPAVDVDNKSFNYYQDMAEKANNPLLNYSYNQLNSMKDVVYTPENTYNRDNLTALPSDRVDLLAGTHLIVCAELRVADDDQGTNMQARDLYRERRGIYYKSELQCAQALARVINSELETQAEMYFHSHDWNGDGKPAKSERLRLETAGLYKLCYNDTPLDDEAIEDLYKQNISLLTDATIKDGDGQKCFWHDNLTLRKVSENGDIMMSDAELRIITGQHDSIDIVDGKKTVIGQVYEYRKESATTDEVRSLIHEWLGPIDHFSEGRMYYYAPVKNLPFKKDGADIYGVVRNAWYQYNLTDITGIGTPVDKPDQPIVPNRTGLENELKFRINLLEWHEEIISVPVNP